MKTGLLISDKEDKTSRVKSARDQLSVRCFSSR